MLDGNLTLLAKKNPSLSVKLNLCEECEFPRAHLNLDLHTLEDREILWIYGVGEGNVYSVIKPWLEAHSTRTLVFLEKKCARLKGFLSTDTATELLYNPQVEFFLLSPSKKQWLTQMKQHINTKMLLQPCILATEEYKLDPTFKDLENYVYSETAKSSITACEFYLFSENFYRNFYNNIWHLPQSYQGECFYSAFKGTPAVICGAGPSLQQHFETLKHLSSKALIFSGGTSTSIFSQEGIIPHFCSAIDPNETEWLHLKDHTLYETPIFYSPRLSAKLLNHTHNPKCYVNEEYWYPISYWLEQQLAVQTHTEKLQFPESFSVTVFNLQLAIAMGCDPLIFVGLDLSCTQEHYAGGVKSAHIESERKMVWEEDLYMTSTYGQEVKTDWMWCAESEVISRICAQYPNKTFLNSTEGGLGIKGVLNEPLEKVISTYLKKNDDLYAKIHQVIATASFTYITNEKIKEHLKTIYRSLIQCLDWIVILLEELQTVLELILHKTKVIPSLRTGKAVLAEESLKEELAFQLILAPKCSYLELPFERGVARRYQGHDSTLLQQKQLIAIATDLEKYSFVKEDITVHLKIMEELACC